MGAMTTSIEKLVKRAKELVALGHDGPLPAWIIDAIESLSAQAAKDAERIRKLEEQLADLTREKEAAEFYANEMNAACDQLTLERDVAKERTDVLEAQIKAFRSAAAQIAVDVARDVAELPDRTSPPDEPMLMLVTERELLEILHHHLDRALMSALQMSEKETKDGE